MYCSRCGAEVSEHSRFCTKCGFSMNTQNVVLEVDQGMGAFIPKNGAALWAYYLGVFSIVCFLLSIPALICGILGVKFANEHPEAKGKAHAWVGIIIGGIGTLLWIFGLFCFMYARFH